MSNNPTSAQDVAFLRELAEAGRQTPSDAGPYLVAGGGWFALASAAIFFVQLGVISAPPSLPLVAMVTASAGFAMTLAVLLRRDRGKVQNDANRFVGSAWSAVGLSIFFFFCAVIFVAVRTGDRSIMDAISLMVLAAYGAAWNFTGQVYNTSLPKVMTALSWVSMLVVAVATGTPWVWLAYAVALALCAVLPGLVLMRKVRTAQA